MKQGVPDWLIPSAEAAPGKAESHLKVLRELLSRDYLSRADWGWALQDLARMAQQALGADKTLVALLHASGAWSAVTSEGKRLDDAEISAHGSRAVLETIRKTQQPILTTRSQPLEVDSESLDIQQVDSVLAVPLYFWDVTRETPQRSLGGCLYAHRSLPRERFADSDVELVLDLTRIAQPNLNLLRYLRHLETDLFAIRQEVEKFRESAARRYRLGSYETRDPGFARTVIEPLLRVASADKVGLLFLGPTGSGKSHLAQAYHYECPRRSGPFVTMDCSQVTSAETLTAELFGYAPASGYANAPPKGRPGKAQLAHRGTLFIEEIAALPQGLQQMLLRLIQHGVFSPLGSSEELEADLQVVAATNEDLQELVGQKRFREDLFWRVGEITLRLPPLSQRAADIPFLAQGFLHKACERYGKPELEGFAEEAHEALRRHDWSKAGNIRGLEHTVNRAVLLCPPETRRLLAEHLQLQALAAGPAAAPAQAAALPAAAPGRSRRPPRRMVDEAERAHLRELLAGKIPASQGKIAALATDPEVAAAFGYERGLMPDSTLAVWIRDLGLGAEIEAQRQRQEEGLDLETLKAAIRQHRSGTAAARALGISRDTLVWRLRKAGLSIEGILGEPA